MMKGNFGVFDGVELIGGTFDDDVDADSYRRVLLQESLPEHLRTAAYDGWQLQVREVPADYDLWWRLLDGLRTSRNRDLAYARFCSLLPAGDRP